MEIFFDVDGTLIGSYDGSLRPHVRETFTKLREDGHNIHIWSGVGIRWAEIDLHDLRGFVVDCYLKPLSHFHDRLQQLGVPLLPDYIIDDHTEIVKAFGGYKIRPYLFRDADDLEMVRVYEDIQRRVRGEGPRVAGII